MSVMLVVNVVIMVTMIVVMKAYLLFTMSHHIKMNIITLKKSF